MPLAGLFLHVHIYSLSIAFQVFPITTFSSQALSNPSLTQTCGKSLRHSKLHQPHITYVSSRLVFFYISDSRLMLSKVCQSPNEFRSWKFRPLAQYVSKLDSLSQSWTICSLVFLTKDERACMQSCYGRLGSDLVWSVSQD